ncbi:indolepyruvate ferredoxin oxidoreductase family protein [Pseudomonadota bacterium]
MAPQNKVSLEDKYSQSSGQVFLTGTQALVRLAITQQQLDRQSGLNTAGFVSGYRGSPLGAFDQQLWRAEKLLKQHHIHFQPGINEEMAGNAVWGTQQINLWPQANYDGVFSIWYGKGPGVDRSGDVLKHANLAGTSKYGGVLAIAGDDHVCRSSTIPHQSEQAFISAMIPILSPAGVQEFIDLGILGWAMSRYSGCWIGFKAIADTVESSATVDVNLSRHTISYPADLQLPEDGLHIRSPDFPPLTQEMRLHRDKLNAVLAFARANRLDQIVYDCPKARLGIIASGKPYLDVCQVLHRFGISEKVASEIGLRLYKVSMPWPLEPTGLRQFARGLEEIIVIEEKRAVIETQIKDLLYHLPDHQRPTVIGKHNDSGEWILPSPGELSPPQIARVIAQRLAQFHTSQTIQEYIGHLNRVEKKLTPTASSFKRTPYFCAGCPHNTSTKVPEGSRALAGIGCHFMVLWMDRNTETFSQMGGEGAAWIGHSPFMGTEHVFTNIGDGTYYHSGILAIRACVAANVNITYKVLFNNAVAMTGGQPMDGPLSVLDVARQLFAEGVRRIEVVSDDISHYSKALTEIPNVSVSHRNDLDRIQKDIRQHKGVSAIIYDQTCATELRRKRKRGLVETPSRQILINEDVCEGCGDCTVKSNCIAIVPKETELGRKRSVDQSACNKDYSCLDGFCPSFVSIEGERRVQSCSENSPSLKLDISPEPIITELSGTYSILITGIGGTGVVTIGAILGMAAHLENKGVSVLDVAGLAQKGGAVTTHVRIADKPTQLKSVRIATAEANLILGCDIVVTASEDTLSKINPAATYLLVNSQQTMTGNFMRDPDLNFPEQSMIEQIEDIAGSDHCEYVDATQIATTLMGDAIATNMFMLGYVFQQGKIPLSSASILEAININGVAIDKNKQAFSIGRSAANNLQALQKALFTDKGAEKTQSSFTQKLEFRIDYLTQYQNANYAQKLNNLVQKTQELEVEKFGHETKFSIAVMQGYFKLLAYKDEYEVARLLVNKSFLKALEDQYPAGYKIKYHLAPPALELFKRTKAEPVKREFGGWLTTPLKLIASLKLLRGTAFDIFGYQKDRRIERQLISEYESTVNNLLEKLDENTLETSIKIAELPLSIRGFGKIKSQSIEAVKRTEQTLLNTL